MWDPAAVSRTLRRLHLPSEAGRRYERARRPGRSRWPRSTAARRCSPRSPAAQSNPTLTDWRGDPPRDDWSPPPVRMAVDLPDRTAGVRLPGRHHAAPADADRRAVSTDGRPIGSTVTPPSWRPDLRAARRPGRGGAAAGGSRHHPVGAAAGTGRPRSDAGPEASPRHRQVAGALRLCRGAADTVPARRGVRPVGPGRRRSAAQHHRRCSTRWRPTAPSWPPRCCRVCWKRWPATCLAAPSTSRCSRSSRWCSRRERTRAVELIPTDRRPTDEEIAQLDASLPRSRSTSAVGAGRPAGAARARGVRADRSRPPTRSRPSGSSAAPPASS